MRLSSSLLILAGLAAAAWAVPLFTNATSTNMPASTSVHSMDAEFGDIDKDGDLDAVIAVETGVNRLYLNDGAGKFTLRANAFGSASYDSEDLQVVDFNRDGNLDVVFVMEDTRIYQLFFGDSAGNFTNVSTRLPRFGEANDVEAVDVNGDGLPDIVVGNVRVNSTTMTGQDYIFINNPADPGTFLDETATRMPVSVDATQDIKLGDLDGDGDLDMVVANEVPPNKLYINAGGGFFKDSSANLQLPVPLETREALLFDVDGDKDLDIVFANLTCNACNVYTKDPQARLLINDGKAHFTDSTATHMPVNTFSSWDGGYLDFDADGDIDLILCAIIVPGFTGAPYRAYRNDGKGHFTDATADVFPSGVTGLGWDVEVADVDKNGTLDLFLAGRASQNILLLGLVQQPTSIRSGRRAAHPRAAQAFAKAALWVNPAGRVVAAPEGARRGVPVLSVK
jgi:hypothetical protein